MKTILWGNYWQTNSIEKEPIEWIVLKEENDKMCVISKYCLDCVPYCKTGETFIWKNSYVRKWLNKVFINDAFSKEEQKRIILSEVKTNRYGWNSTPKFDNLSPLDTSTVKDRVFLLSRSESCLFFDSDVWYDVLADQKRIAEPTVYAYKRGCWIYPLKKRPIKEKDTFNFYKEDMGQSLDEIEEYWEFEDSASCYAKDNTYQTNIYQIQWACAWYLRSPGFETERVAPNGTLRRFSNSDNGTAIRPAMWIKK